MKTAAIIAEYNPFHNGHLYQIAETRRQTGADFILIVMSGDFVQRGAPALCNKYLRTQMALSCGADVVIELPSLYALSSAEFFAGGAVTLLNDLNVVDILSFGSESGDLDFLMGIGRILTGDPDPLKSGLKDKLKKGASYPAAMAEAALQALPTMYPFPKSGSQDLQKSHLPSGKDPIPAYDMADLKRLFSSPNNILGLEYCKALLTTGSAIRPFTLKREGSGHHGLALKAGGDLAHTSTIAGTFSPFASASAIRNALNRTPEAVKDYMPEDACHILTKNGVLSTPICEDDFSRLLYYKLLLEKEQGFAAYLDCGPDLSDKICKNLQNFTSFSGFCHLIKSREVTYAHISRALMHILLDIKTPEYFKRPFPIRELPAPYARLLGFRSNARPLLSAIKKNSKIVLLSKPAKASSLLDGHALALFKQDVFCSSLYESIRQPGVPFNEMKHSPMIFS